MAKVALVKTGQGPRAIRTSVNRALEMLGGIRHYVSPGQRVLVKPNFVAAVPSAVTDLTVLASVIDEVRSVGAVPFLGECPGFEFDSSATLRYLRVDKFAQDNAVNLINLEADSYVDQPFDHPFVKSVKVAASALEADAIINVPKMKSHKLTTVSMAIKNSFGLLAKESRRQIHALGLHRGIAALYKLFQPVVSVMDGLTIPSTGAVYGSRIDLGIIAASSDMLSLDLACSPLLGAQPEDVEHLALAARYGITPVEILGDHIQPVRVSGLENTPRRWLYRAGYRSVYAFDCMVAKFGSNTIIPWFHNRFGLHPVINWSKCNDCGDCQPICEVNAIDIQARRIDYGRCAHLRCMACIDVCPRGAISTAQSYRSM